MRPTVTKIENCINVHSENPVRAVSGNRSYSRTTNFGKKMNFVGNSHVRPIKRYLFDNSTYEGNAHLNGFSGANIIVRRSTRYCYRLSRIQ